VRSRHSLLALVVGLGLTLSACSSSSGTLTESDIPSYLHLVQNTSEPSLLNDIFPRWPGCTSSSVVAFTPVGKRVIGVSSSEGGAEYVEVLSFVSSCGTSSKAHASFANVFQPAPNSHRAFVPPLKRVAGVGNEAVLLDEVFGDRSYALLWLSGPHLGFVFVQGPPGDTHVTLGLAKQLAEDAVANS